MEARLTLERATTTSKVMYFTERRLNEVEESFVFVNGYFTRLDSR
jgi:hypothetical protein